MITTKSMIKVYFLLYFHVHDHFLMTDQMNEIDYKLMNGLNPNEWNTWKTTTVIWLDFDLIEDSNDEVRFEAIWQRSYNLSKLLLFHQLSIYFC